MFFSFHVLDSKPLLNYGLRGARTDNRTWMRTFVSMVKQVLTDHSFSEL